MTTEKNTAKATQGADVMTYEEARELTDAIKGNLHALAKHVMRALEGKAYKALGYTSVKEWADIEFQRSRSRMYQYAAWKRAEFELIEMFNLADDWQSNEEALRVLDWNELVEDATAELADIGDQARRGLRLIKVINDKFGKVKESQREAAKRAKGGKPAASTQPSDSGTERKDSDSESKMSEPVASPPYYLVQARETGTMLADLDDSDSVDDVLVAAELALEDLNALIAKLKDEAK